MNRPTSRSKEHALAWRSLWISWSGPDQRTAALRQLAQTPSAAVLLFRRHVPDLETTLALSHEILAASDGATRIAIDEEGGRVRRLPLPFPPFPAAADWLERSPQALQRAASELGTLLTQLGIAINLAPVADLAFDSEHPALATRCFGDDPTVVGSYVAAMTAGLLDGCGNACLKHFPGHGAVPADSHLELSTLARDLEQVRTAEWMPFRRGIEAGATLIMSGHFHWPTVDADGPVTFSRPTLELLRTELGFGGAILTDDLEMHAIADRWSVPEAALEAIVAGHNGVLICKEFELAAEAAELLTYEAEKSAAFRTLLRDNAGRADRLPQVAGPPAVRPDLEQRFAAVDWPKAEGAESDPTERPA